MQNFDVIIVGAGHNGLATGALLAGRGLRVLVLEKNRYVGRTGSPQSGSRPGRLPRRAPPMAVVAQASWRSNRSCSPLQSMQRLATGRARRRLGAIGSPQLSHSP